MTHDRNVVVDMMRAWNGCKQGDARHKHIIDIYNEYSRSGKAARKAVLSYTSPWCAATVSAAYITSGYTDIFPCVECSCGKMIELAKNAGIWQESDAYVPNPGDLIIYDWEDTGFGDDTQGHDHVGMVVNCDGSSITVIEGNKGDEHVCGTRTIKVNGKYIRGFVVPKFTDDAVYYTVVKGDTLTKISRMYGTTVNEILKLNDDITNPNRIYVGQKVRVR